MIHLSRILILMALWAVTGVAAQQGTGAVVGGERLSDWWLRQSPQPPYPEGVSLRVPQERAAQATLQKELLVALKARSQGEQLADIKKSLGDWIEQQTVTGRVVIANTDPRWLEVQKSLDPILAQGQTLITPDRPTTVTVLKPNGQLCQVKHSPLAVAHGYLSLCGIGDASKVWIAQPDGRSFVYGISAWNAESQAYPAPGAWLWAQGISPEFSSGLVRFLGSLGPAPDLAQGSVPMALATPGYLQRGISLSSSDWGEVGLLQTPTARMKPVGDMRLKISKVRPYTRSTVMFQPLDILEGGFRYTDIDNRSYDGTGALQTDQSYKDKSLDFKLRLHQESDLMPALALGVRDIGGTGFFSSEYLVASKRLGDADVSLGLGWGNMGSLGHFRKASVRPSTQTVSGGEVGTKAFFKGPGALFGGIQWQVAPEVTLKLERDGNSYQAEPLSNPQITRSPWNIGLNYRYSAATDVAIGFERGNTLMLGLTFSADLDGMRMPKLLQPVQLAFRPLAATSESRLDSDQQLKRLQRLVFEQTGWQLESHIDQNTSIQWIISAEGAVHRRERLDRLNAILQAEAAPQVLRWEIQFVERGLAIDSVTVDRKAWIEQQGQNLPLSLRAEAVLAFAPSLEQAKLQDRPSNARISDAAASPLKFTSGPNFSHVLGGPDAFILYRLGFDVSAQFAINPSTWLEGTLDFRLLDNYNTFKYTAPSNLPRVRTYAREFETTSRVTMPVLQATQVASPANDHYTSVYGGYLESMYAGVGGEWLYRPWRSPIAMGVDVNHVRQRDFEQDFGLRSYRVNTGHLTAYWDTGVSDLLVKLQVGQYLAGDRGATLDISRRFANGVVLGAFATKTNVSAEQFGEGGFDKGLYLSLPFDVMLPKYSDSAATLNWKPLTRDGGARLMRQNQLYSMTSGRDRRALEFGTASKEEIAKQADLLAFTAPAALAQVNRAQSNALEFVSNVGHNAVNTAVDLTHPETRSAWLWGAGLVLASSALDQKADRWALNHSGLSRLAKLGNAAPLLLGLGALGDLGDRGVGWTALQSAGFVYAANAALRVGFGRARPYEDLGSKHFDAFTAQGMKSSFASNHSAVAFALATPFAQTYDMPWLYGAAALTGLGRVQSRQHWLSDTVAGSVLGYAVGSVMTDQHKQTIGQNGGGRQLLLLPNGVAAKWWWQ